MSAIGITSTGPNTSINSHCISIIAAGITIASNRANSASAIGIAKARPIANISGHCIIIIAAGIIRTHCRTKNNTNSRASALIPAKIHGQRITVSTISVSITNRRAIVRVAYTSFTRVTSIVTVASTTSAAGSITVEVSTKTGWRLADAIANI
ncbi:MAG: hypothetical protein Q8N60_03210 [Candidatus Diapherotrites archaeon]|nr:hypothetical protein [Candidatus Diapherotrites archaeon]